MNQPTPDIRITPHLRIRDAAGAIDFYKRAFGAAEAYRLAMPDGTVVYAEMHIGGARFELGEESDEGPSLGPRTLHGTSVAISLTVPDVDAFVEKAVAAGAEVTFPPKDQFYGWRQGRVQDPYGHDWIVGTPLEDLSPEEMQRRMDAMMQQG